MDAADHYPALKRTGLVLLIVGILDIGLMAYAMFNQIAYMSSLNIFAVIAGIFLLRGNLRAASIVRRFALFLLAACISVSLVLPLLQPIDLIVTRAQLDPLAFLGYFVFLVLALVLFSWLIRELGSTPIRLAYKKAGLPARSSGIPLALGIGLAVILAAVGTLVQHSESGIRAVRETREKLGDGYRYHVSSFSYNSSSKGESVSGVVTAWKSGSVKDLPFQWRE
jgi:hypothetical protein